MKYAFSGLILFVSLFYLFSCSTTVPLTEFDSSQPVAASSSLSVQDKLVEAAYWARGKKRLTVRGKSFGRDCTGIILAVYYYAGIDLARDFNRYTGNGVKRIHSSLKDNSLLYQTQIPVPGDLIFWNNTWDANSNGVADDLLTHVGMVVTMNRNGQGSYLHYNYAKGITIEKINFLKPNSPEHNAPIRMRSLPKVEGYQYLSSQLVQDLARAYELGYDFID